jgi:2-phospho-L-lactate/phosphoenolpyruvate guanylyltransferase
MTRVVVLIKDFDAAKQRLSPALDARRRRELSGSLALKALTSAGPDAIVVAGSPEVAVVARSRGNEVVLEDAPAGQREAARRGIDRAVELGATAVLIMSSDLPLISHHAIRQMVRTGERLGSPSVLAAPAIGRGGTNALFLSPPDVIGLHFGDDSLAKFEADARARSVRFERFESEAFSLDIDEPSDLELAGYEEVL